MLRQCLVSLFVIIALACLAGCAKQNDNGGTFTVKGRWLKDCSGTAHANEALDVSFLYENYNTKDRHDHIGAGSTDADGYFSIVCRNYGNGTVTLINTASMGIDGFVKGGAGQTDDLGTFYDAYSAGAKLKFVFARPHPDTLFVDDLINRDTFYIYPASGTSVVTLSTKGSGKPSTVFQGHYGLGRADFNRPVNSGDSRIILLPNALKPCSAGDTSVIMIP